MVLKGCESSYTKLSLASLPVRSTEWEGTGGEIKLSLTEVGEWAPRVQWTELDKAHMLQADRCFRSLWILGLHTLPNS